MSLAGGGTFGGGGASAGFDAPSGRGSGSSGGSFFSRKGGGRSGGGGLDLDDGWLVLLAFALLVLAIAGPGGYLVYQAPHILAEAAFQVTLATSLRRTAKRLVSLGWTESVLKSTWIPFAIVLAMAGTSGWVAHRHCPTATRVSEVLFGCVLGS